MIKGTLPTQDFIFFRARMRHLISNEIGEPYFKGIVNEVENLHNEKSHMILGPSQILNLSTFYFLRGEYQKSFDLIDWGNSMYKNMDDFTIEKCKIFILLGQYKKALATLDTLQNPTSIYAIYERIKLAMLTDKTKDAQFYVSKILDKVPSKETLYIYLAFFFIKNKKVECAKKCWEAACKNPTDDYNFKLTKIAIEYGTGQYNEAYKHSLSLCKKHPNDLVLHFYLTSLSILLDKKKKSPQLLKQLKEVDTLNKITINLEKDFNKQRYSKIYG